MDRAGPMALAAVLLPVVASTAGCAAGAGAAAEGDRLQIVTTVAPITSLVATIGGDRVEIRGIVPEGTNSHTFEPAPSVAASLERADVVFMNGLMLEEPTRELAEGNVRRGTEIVELGSETITPDQYLYDLSFPRDEGRPNPHLWTDPPMALRYAAIVEGRLSALDPAGADHYQANYDAFADQVAALDRAMRTAFATVPRDARKLLTYHDAYAYFARDYGFRVIGAIQVSDFEDPTPREVAALIEQVESERVPAVFGSEVFPSPVLAQIGKETGARYVDVLRDDDLPGRPGDPEHSWLGLMRFDFATMVEALGGDASPMRALDIRPRSPDRAEYPQ